MSLVVRAAVPERGVDLELEVPSGSTTALVGPNGAGKSTLLALIGGLLRPHSGHIVLEEQELVDITQGRARTWVPPHARAVATLGQDPALFPHLTALGNIMFGLRARGVPARRARAEARGWLAEVGLTGLAARRPSQLSGGQAQRVAIARALAIEPRLLLLDEPMAALDVDVAPALREQLRRFLDGRTALVVSHDVLDAMTLAQDVAVLESGRLVERGPTLEVLSRPRSAFAARFAGLNLLTGRWDGQAVSLEAGEQLLVGTPVTTPPGTQVRAAFRPSSVGILGSGPAAPGTTTLRGSVSVMQPLGDLVRVQVGDVIADVTPQQAAELDLQPGTEVSVSIDAEAVTAYPAAGRPATGSRTANGPRSATSSRSANGS